ALGQLRTQFPNAWIDKGGAALHDRALQVFSDVRGDHSRKEIKTLQLHLKGTPFQLKVWEALLQIPIGRLSSYATVAHNIGSPNASRAVGTAIGKNPIAYLIPCHRVIQSGGLLGGYRWGTTRKTAMIGWEAAQVVDVWNGNRIIMRRT
ncbi:MAG: methylated-DNA--[protein]-cysteine S-methyltransferase, partial [Cryomorphaceae bacterium]